jgi:hypothetical protein
MNTLLFTLTLSISAAGTPEAMDEAAGMPPPHARDAAMMTTTPVGVPGQGAQIENESTRAVTASVEPVTGWRRGRRAPIYISAQLLGEGFVEDGQMRLTGRETRTLEGVGGLFRAGAVLGEHSRLGVRLQTFSRPTKTVLDENGTPSSPRSWGSVQLGYIGPEYLYVMDSGVYVAGSVGVAGVASTRTAHCTSDWNACRDGDRHENEIQRAVGGGAALASVGYEWRVHKWFALSTEVFGGVYGGVNENEQSMSGSIFGVGVGAGF